MRVQSLHALNFTIFFCRTQEIIKYTFLRFYVNHKTASVFWWTEFLAIDPEVPGSITGVIRFFLEVVGLELGTLSLVSITEELLEWKSSGSWSRKSRLTAVGIRCAEHFGGKRRSVGRYSSLAD
jgi:hypothetical protein